MAAHLIMLFFICIQEEPFGLMVALEEKLYMGVTKIVKVHPVGTMNIHCK